MIASDAARIGLRVRRRDVLGAGGHDDLLHVLLRELRQPQLAVHGPARARRPLAHGAQPVLGHRPQRAVHAPVALQHEVVVEVLGVEVAGAEHVVVALDRAEPAEDEVRAGEEQRHGVRGAAHVRLADQRVVARARLEVAEHDQEVLGEQLAHAVGHAADHAGAVDAAVLHALGAHGAGQGDAARLEAEHRAALGGAHQRLRAAAARDPHLEPAGGVGRAEERLGPGRVVAVDEDLLGAVEADGLGVGGEPPQAELELERLLDRALRERAGGADLRADEHRERVGRRVGVDRHGGLDLAEAVGDRGRGVGGEQQRVVEPVGDVRLVARRPAHAHLAHRHLQLDRAQQGDDAGELLRRRPGGETDDLGARDVRVDDQAGERDVVERVRLLGDGRVQAARGDERVDEVEVRGRVPSSSTTRPSASSATEGSGSFAEANATSPASSSRRAKPSRLTGRLVQRLEAAEPGRPCAGPAPAAVRPASSHVRVVHAPILPSSGLACQRSTRAGVVTLWRRVGRE